LLLEALKLLSGVINKCGLMSQSRFVWRHRIVGGSATSTSATTALFFLRGSLVFRGGEHRANTGEPLSHSSAQLAEGASSGKLISSQLARGNGRLPCSSDRSLLRAALHDGVCGSQAFSQVGAPHVSGNSPCGL
jgi:hypothetical protein